MSELPGQGHLRASHAEREQVIGTLKAAFVQGRLTKDELDLRVGQALASRTHAELFTLTADLPAGLTPAEPPTPARSPAKRPVLRRPGVAMATATVIYAGMWPLAASLPTNSEGDPDVGVALLGWATVLYMLIMISACVWAQVRASRWENPAGGQLPGRSAPGVGGHPHRRLPSAHSRGQESPADRHTAEAARRRLPHLGRPTHGHRASDALAPGTAPACG